MTTNDWTLALLFIVLLSLRRLPLHHMTPSYTSALQLLGQS